CFKTCSVSNSKCNDFSFISLSDVRSLICSISFETSPVCSSVLELSALSASM
ncbi:Uncharacterized protein APZ42_009134, partial [Daphnia magna]